MKYRFPLFFFIAFIYVGGFFLLDNWRKIYDRGDDTGYYLHVVSFWKNQDVGDYSKTLGELVGGHPHLASLADDPYLIRTTKKGKKYIKYTLGVGIMQSPFFLIADLYARHSSNFSDGGWSLPYYLCVSLSNVFCVLLGLWLLLLVLEKYFSKRVVIMTLIGVALATNLYYQTTAVTMAHGFLFFDYCLLIWLTYQFYQFPNKRKALGVGAIVGLIGITRIPEVMSIIIPLLWGIGNFENFKKRLQFFTHQYPYFLLIATGFLLVFSIQIVYWYYVSGQLLFNPYQGEGFDFLNPHILEGLFSFKNGWLIYTPIMLFALIGLLFLKKQGLNLILAILLFLIPHFYIHYSYYAWTYFPGLGARPMVETYPLLSFGLAAFFHQMTKKKWQRWMGYGLLIFFTWLNLFQVWQSEEGIIRTSKGSLAYYYETFSTMHPSRNALRSYDLRIFQPNPKKLSLQEVLASVSFEDTSHFEVSNTVVHSGLYAYRLKKDQMFLTIAEKIPLQKSYEKSWLKTEIQAYLTPEDKISGRDRLAKLVLELYDEKGERQLYKSIKISSHIGDFDNSIWRTGEPNEWGEASYFILLPPEISNGWTIKIYILNEAQQQLYLDDFKLSRFTQK